VAISRRRTARKAQRLQRVAERKVHHTRRLLGVGLGIKPDACIAEANELRHLEQLQKIFRARHQHSPERLYCLAQFGGRETLDLCPCAHQRARSQI
jgi:hypothetical protein